MGKLDENHCTEMAEHGVRASLGHYSGFNRGRFNNIPGNILEKLSECGDVVAG
jgi:hypothetical protein